MDKRVLKPEQIIVPGEYQLGNDAILQTYFGIYNNGGGEYIAPVLIARNNPEVIRKTIEGKVRGEIDKMKSPIEDHQKIDGLIGISMSPDDRPMGLPFGEMLMKNFGFSGEWDDFKEKYDQGFFHPMYINPSVCRLVGEEDIVETCEKDNFRLTYGNEVLTKQQHEKMKQEFGGKLRAESDRLFKMKYSPLEDIDNLSRELLENGAEYLLIDGNHRAVASTLTQDNVSGLLIESEDDIKEAVAMVESGKIREFSLRPNNIGDLLMGFYGFCRDRTDKTTTLRDRVNQLASNGDLPQYMVDEYAMDTIKTN